MPHDNFSLSLSHTGLSKVRNPLDPSLFGSGDVLQQCWPTVDTEYLQTPDTVEVSVRVRHTNKFALQICNISALQNAY